MAVADQTFVDYYEMLRVSPGAELESIQRVHRDLAVLQGIRDELKKKGAN